MAMEGVETRHSANCNKRKIGKRSRCNCQASYRAWISDKKNGGVIKLAWTKDKDKAQSERRDLERAQEAGALTTTETEIPYLDDFARNVFIPGITNKTILSDKRKPYKPGTARGYRGALNKHVLTAPELKDKRLDQITRKDLLAIVTRMLADEYAAWSIHNVKNAVCALLRYAIHCEILPADFNPATNLGIPTGARRKVVQEPTGAKGEMVIRGAAEVIEMIEVLPVEERAMFATAALAGLRRGELRGLQVRHVDLRANLIRARFGWDDCEGQIDLKSDASERDVPILKALRPYLEAHLQRLGPDVAPDAPFFGVRQRGVIDPDKYMRRIREVWTKHGIIWLQLHDARHSFASFMIAAGANIKQISEIMGHSDIQVTLNDYGHLLPGSHQEAADKMDAWMERTVEPVYAIAA